MCGNAHCNIFLLLFRDRMMILNARKSSSNELAPGYSRLCWVAHMLRLNQAESIRHYSSWINSTNFYIFLSNSHQCVDRQCIDNLYSFSFSLIPKGVFAHRFGANSYIIMDFIFNFTAFYYIKSNIVPAKWLLRMNKDTMWNWEHDRSIRSSLAIDTVMYNRQVVLFMSNRSADHVATKRHTYMRARAHTQKKKIKFIWNIIRRRSLSLVRALLLFKANRSQSIHGYVSIRGR